MANQSRPTWDSESTLPVRPQPAASRPLPDVNNDPCAKPAQTKTEKLDCLNKEHQDRPGDPLVREQIYEEVKEVVDRDPFLEYHAESTSAYRVIDRHQQVLIVPKERARPEPYPVQRPEPIRQAYRFLLYAALGLVLSGLGAVIFAPVAVLHAIHALNAPQQGEENRANRVRARVVISLSVLLFAAGLVLAYLLWIHIRG